MKILFMCVANSARSQLAEGLARQLLPQAEIRSAGSQPGKLNPHAAAIMKEIGIDISEYHSKSADDLAPAFLMNLDYVITLCAEEVCPTLVSKTKKIHWPHPDPGKAGTEEQKIQSFREVRDAIQARIVAFKAEIGE